MYASLISASIFVFKLCAIDTPSTSKKPIQTSTRSKKSKVKVRTGLPNTQPPLRIVSPLARHARDPCSYELSVPFQHKKTIQTEGLLTFPALADEVS
jgi:hypothetical protein